MSYQSPIAVITEQMKTNFEDGIFKAIQKCNILVSKEELIKALTYDRDQYVKGYNDRDAEIIRCKDCKYVFVDKMFGNIYCHGKLYGCLIEPDDYCSKGEKGEWKNEQIC